MASTWIGVTPACAWIDDITTTTVRIRHFTAAFFLVVTGYGFISVHSCHLPLQFLKLTWCL